PRGTHMTAQVRRKAELPRASRRAGDRRGGLGFGRGGGVVAVLHEDVDQLARDPEAKIVAQVAVANAHREIASGMRLIERVERAARLARASRDSIRLDRSRARSRPHVRPSRNPAWPTILELSSNKFSLGGATVRRALRRSKRARPGGSGMENREMRVRTILS